MGERWWSERVAQARERESLVLAVRAGCASGLPLSEGIAAAARASPTKPHVATISRWIARFERQGWVGLVDRRGPSESADREMPARLLRGVELRPGDYRETLRDAGAGDLVYLDPPYLVPGTRGSRCHRYQPEAFDERAHEELAEVFRDLDARGCAVVLSNSGVPEVRGLYRGHRIGVLSTRRSVHFSVDRRTGNTEEVVSNRDPQPSADQLSLFAE